MPNCATVTAIYKHSSQIWARSLLQRIWWSKHQNFSAISDNREYPISRLWHKTSKTTITPTSHLKSWFWVNLNSDSIFLHWWAKVHQISDACTACMEVVIVVQNHTEILMFFGRQSFSLIHFLQHVSIACYGERCISYSKSVRLSVRPSVCLSVCLPVTRWHWVKTTQATIMGSSLEDSPMNLVSSTLDFTAKFQREHGERGRRMREG